MDALALRTRIESIAKNRDGESWKEIFGYYSRWLDLDPESAAAHVLFGPYATGRSLQVFREWALTDRDAAFVFSTTGGSRRIPKRPSLR